jgi:hypothetical protein
VTSTKSLCLSPCRNACGISTREIWPCCPCREDPRRPPSSACHHFHHCCVRVIDPSPRAAQQQQPRPRPFRRAASQAGRRRHRRPPAVCVVPSSDLMMRLLHFVGVLCSSSAVASAQPGMTGGMPPPVRPPLARPCMHLSLHPPHSFSATTTCESCHRPVTTYAAS